MLIRLKILESNLVLIVLLLLIEREKVTELQLFGAHIFSILSLTFPGTILIWRFRIISKVIGGLQDFYDFLEMSRRKDSWNFLQNLHCLYLLLWYCIGDFNDMLSNEDMNGEVEHPTWCIRGFRNVISDCDLHCLPLKSYSFTWERSKGMKNVVDERLDRSVIMSSWMNIFP